MPYLPWAGGWQNLCRKIPASPFSPERDPVLLNTPWAQTSLCSEQPLACSRSAALCSTSHFAAWLLLLLLLLCLGGNISSLPGSQPSSWDKTLHWGLWKKSPSGSLGMSLPGSLGSAAIYPFRGAFTWEFKFSRLSSTESLDKKSWILRHKVCNIWLVTTRRW